MNNVLEIERPNVLPPKVSTPISRSWDIGLAEPELGDECELR
jgi:hypothetical protein